jgi:putative ABC transport system permease protein
MSAIELIRLALSRLGSSRLRAALTMLGVIIGVASVVALVGVAQGTTANITTRLSSLGTNLLTVNPGAARTGLTPGAAGSAASLTLDDATAIASLPSVAAVAPEVSTQRLVEVGDESSMTTIIGTTADYPSVRAYAIAAGSFLTDPMVELELRTAVLGAATADALGLTPSDLGATVRIDGVPFTVVGVLEAKGGSGFQNPDDQVFVPVSVVQRQFVGGDSVRTVGVSVAEADQIEGAKDALTQLLRTRHGLASTASDDFQVFDQAQLLETASAISGTLTLLLGGIASISLLVGGIGIMNIMLVSVRERTREIGIRKAIGARARDILAQFLVEALTISVLGGVVGIVLGIGASAVIARLAGWPVVISPATVVVAVAFSLVVGIVFGVWPARQAARLDPIVALRYE